jgi:hypothetical protein
MALAKEWECSFDGADKRSGRNPNRLVNTPSRYLELLEIASTSENPSCFEKRDSQCDDMASDTANMCTKL